MMSREAHLKTRLVERLEEVDPKAWDCCANPEELPFNPFLSHRFLVALEQSGSVSPETGWHPVHLLVEDENSTLVGCLPLYLKMHSHGEYVFDHGWAEAYERAGGHYYPKLLSAIPFTPVPGRRLLLKPGPQQDLVASTLIHNAMAYVESQGLSSLHINFLDESQLTYFSSPSLLIRTGHQFHFENENFSTFDDFLGSLASRKRKSVRKERQSAIAAGIEIRQLKGDELKSEHWDAFFHFYMDTGARKWGRPYLTRDFFERINQSMGDHILMVLAYREGKPIAGALNFIGSDTLYGRYWGASEYHPCLHFEVCYYQAIEFAITHKLKRVEAGAQGEHKLARGYLPVTTHSVHYLPDPHFRSAVEHFLSNEGRYIKMEHEILTAHSPFSNKKA